VALIRDRGKTIGLRLLLERSTMGSRLISVSEVLTVCVAI
jgi:hypothetical protein